VTKSENLHSAARDCGPTDADTFRTLWRGFGCTVAVVATEHEGKRYAMLATAVTSVSMDPPSLLICVNRSASAFPALVARGAFSLGIVSSGHYEICGYLASASSAERFNQGDWRRHKPTGGPTSGLPWLAETQASLFCENDQTSDYGTHRIIIARVVGAEGCFGNDPLLYCDGRFGHFVEIGS